MITKRKKTITTNMNQVNFQNSLARAQELMLSEEFNAKVESKAGNARKKGNSSNDLALFEAQAFGYSPSQEQTYEQVPTVSTKRPIEQIGLPNAILESFKKMPPMSGDENNGNTMGLLNEIANSIGAAPQRQMSQVPRNTINEQQTAATIDYSLIKTIVEECFRQYEKKQLNEGVVRGFKIGTGNKVQFVDSKGNLYEGVLTLKKRAQTK